jgi:hypothetical protein
MRYDENINTKVYDECYKAYIQRTDSRTTITGFNRDDYNVRPVAIKKVNRNGKVYPFIRYKNKFAKSFWFYNVDDGTRYCRAYDMYFVAKAKQWFSAHRNYFVMTSKQKQKYYKLNGAKFTSDEEKMYGSAIETMYTIVSEFKEGLRPIRKHNSFDSYKTERFNENIGFDIYDPADDTCEEAG